MHELASLGHGVAVVADAYPILVVVNDKGLLFGLWLGVQRVSLLLRFGTKTEGHSSSLYMTVGIEQRNISIKQINEIRPKI